VTGRLNRVVDLIAAGQPAFGSSCAPGSISDAVWHASSDYDFLVFEQEHQAFDLDALRLSLQFLLDRRQLVEGGTLAPRCVPFVRIPTNGRESSQWVVKQVLDIGVYGILFPMINTPDEAIAALRACRYPQSRGAADAEPRGLRGHSPGTAMRYWGLDEAEYTRRADVWPLDADGEILPCLMCETPEAIENLPRILDAVGNKPGVIHIAEKDLSVSMGLDGKYTPEVASAVQRALAICRERGVPCGSPQVRRDNVEQRIRDGFLFLMPRPGRDTSALQLGRQAGGR
jgi:4-hydroxy-2-oxoheptanedioate aldolase